MAGAGTAGTAAGTSALASTATFGEAGAAGGMSTAQGGLMSAAPPSTASAAMSTEALASSAGTGMGNTGGAAAGGNVTPYTGGAGFQSGQGFVGGFIQNLLGTGYQGHGRGGEGAQLGGGLPVESTAGAQAMAGAKETPKGFLGLSDMDRRELMGQSLGSMFRSGMQAQQAQSLAGGGGGQPMDMSTGLPMMAEGGQIPPGGAAVAGEAGPEVVTASPQGGATVQPHPTGQPQAAPGQTPAQAGAQAKAQAPAIPTESGLWPHIGAHIEDALIFVNALRDPSIFLQMRNLKYQRTAALAQMGARDPRLLNTPAVAEAVDSFLGPGSAANLSPSGHNGRVASAFGVNVVPEGTQMPDGSVAPNQNAQIIRGLASTGVGAKMDEKGYIIPNVAAGSYADRAAAFGWQRFNETRQTLTQNGVDWTSANILGANRAISEMAAARMPPPRELVNLALGDLTAEQAEEGRNRSNVRNAFALSRERGGGAVVGKAGGEASIAAASTRIPLGAGAAPELTALLEQQGYKVVTDERGNSFAERSGAVNLGEKVSQTDPRLIDLEQRGFTIKTDPSGNVIAEPPGGVGEKGTRPGALTMKAGDIKLFNSLRDGIQSLNNPQFINRLPDEEKEGRTIARLKGKVGGPLLAIFDDPAEMQKQRARLAEMRASAEKLYQGTLRGQYMVQLLDGLTGDIENRRATKQQWIAGMSVFNEMVEALGPSASLKSEPPISKEEQARIDAAMSGETPKQGSKPLDESAFMERVGKGEFSPPKAKANVPAGSPARAAARDAAFRKTGGTLRNMEAQLEQAIAKGEITEEQAIQKLRAAQAAGLPME